MFPLRTVLPVALAIGYAHAQQFPLRKLGPISDLGLRGTAETSRDLGIARLVLDGGSRVRLEGRDRAGKPWRVWVDRGGLVAGAADLWTGDFDANGTQDLLIGRVWGSNGRCVDGGSVTTLMFGEDGRPVPWVMETHPVAWDALPLLLDLDHDGRAEIVVTECEYSDPSDTERFGEDRWIVGVYAARETRWIPLPASDVDAYSRAAKELYRNARNPDFVHWLPPRTKERPDPLGGLDAPASVRLTGLETGEFGCAGIHLQVEDGRVITPAEDPCEEATYERAMYSDGKTRIGWPLVLIDSRDGREIHLVEPQQALLRLMRFGYRLKVLGDDEQPVWLWADASVGAVPGNVQASLRLSAVSRRQVTNLAPTSTPYGALTMRRQGTCFTWALDRAAAFGVPNCGSPAFLSETGDYWIREGTVWQIPAGENRIRAVQTRNREELLDLPFDPPQRSAPLSAALRLGDLWLTEWGAGNLYLHTAEGRLLNRLPSGEGDLLFAEDRSGVYFVLWKNGRPVELRQVRVSVQWTR